MDDSYESPSIVLFNFLDALAPRRDCSRGTSQLAGLTSFYNFFDSLEQRRAFNARSNFYFFFFATKLRKKIDISKKNHDKFQ